LQSPPALGMLPFLPVPDFNRITHMPAGKWSAIAFVLLLLGGCASPGLIVIPGAPARLYSSTPVTVLTGKASYYWEPQPTASGERFNPEALTAAHKSLPLGTMVRVVNLRNNKSTIVRINDRGPYVRGRIIDLSRAAARQIDMVHAGVVPVRVEVLKPIETVEKPNLRLTAKMRTDAEARAKASEKIPPARQKNTPPPTVSKPEGDHPPEPRKHRAR